LARPVGEGEIFTELTSPHALAKKNFATRKLLTRDLLCCS